MDRNQGNGRGTKRNVDEDDWSDKRFKSSDHSDPSLENFYDTLMSIFPDCDGDFLRDYLQSAAEAGRMDDVYEIVLEFVMNDYPRQSTVQVMHEEEDPEENLSRDVRSSGHVYRGSAVSRGTPHSHLTHSLTGLNQRRVDGENILREAHQSGALVTCSCCTGEVFVEHTEMCKAGHIFCHQCIRSAVEAEMHLARHQCLEYGCHEVYDMTTLGRVLHSHTLSLCWRRVQKAEILQAGVENVVFCPRCSYGAILEPQCDVFSCRDPACQLVSCRRCQKANHSPLPCENAEDTQRIQLEQQMIKAEAPMRQCYSCREWYDKVVGCDHVICRCGAAQCYRCSAPLIPDVPHICRNQVTQALPPNPQHEQIQGGRQEEPEEEEEEEEEEEQEAEEEEEQEAEEEEEQEAEEEDEQEAEEEEEQEAEEEEEEEQDF